MSEPLTYEFKFFGGFARQRKRLLAAENFIAPALSEPVTRVMAELQEVHSVNIDDTKIGWRSCFFGHSERMRRASLWSLAAACCVLIAVLSSERVLASLATPGIALLYVVLFLSGEILGHTSRYFESLARAELSLVLRCHLLAVINRKLQALEPLYRTQLSKGNLKTLVGSDVEAIVDFVVAVSAQWLPVMTVTALLTPVLYLYAGSLGILAVLIALVQAPIAWGLSHLLEFFQFRAQGSQDQLTGLLGEWLRAMRLSRALGWQEPIRRRAAQFLRQNAVRRAFKHALECFMYGVSGGWWMVPIFSLLWFSQRWSTPIATAKIFATIWALSYLTNYIQHIPWSFTLFGPASAAMRRIRELTEGPEQSAHFEQAANPPSAEVSIVADDPPIALELESVSLRYPSSAGVAAIEDLSLRIDLNKRLAIVGEVGCGKSTLLKLLIGELPPTSGRIMVCFASGARVSLWNRSVWTRFRREVAYVPQESFLSNASVSRNITLDNVSVDGKVQSAAQAAQLERDVTLFRHGFAEEVGEIGINLSGGQKSRVSIARAFYSGRPLLVLDDPLSAVDPRTEGDLLNSIFAHSKGCIMTSHRLAHLVRCDEVMVLAHGKVVERGVPADLCTVPGSAFRELLEHGDEEAEATVA